MTHKPAFVRPVLLLGGSGMLGRAWREVLERSAIDYVAPPRAQLDIAVARSLSNAVTDRFSLVINAAGYTDVDGCETEEGLPRQINGYAVRNLATTCANARIKLLHYSTDYVFDGNATVPYATAAARTPINAYGRTKMLGEQLIESSNCDYLIIRTSSLYAPWGRNFVRTILGLAEQREMLSVVDDQHGRPTSAQHLAAASLELLLRGASGTYHVTDGGPCTWFELARHVLSVAGSSCEVRPCTSAEFPRPAQRPRYSVLDVSRTEQLLGPLPHWQANVESVLERMQAVVP